MSVALVILLVVLLDVGIVALLRFVMAQPRKLGPHGLSAVRNARPSRRRRALARKRELWRADTPGRTPIGA